MSKQKNLTDADHKIIVEAYNQLSDKDSLSKNKIKKILNEQLGYSESSIYRVITAEQKKSTKSEDSITKLLQQINKYTNSNIAEQLKKMNLEQLLNKYEQINPADVAYRTLIEKLMIERQSYETKMSLLEKQHQIDKDKYADNQARREHELAQLETQKQNKQIASENADKRLQASENARSKTVEKAQAQTEAIKAKTDANELKRIRGSVIEVETKIKGRFSQSRADAQNAEICNKFKGIPELQSEYDEALKALKQSFEAGLKSCSKDLDLDSCWKASFEGRFNVIKKYTSLESALFYLNQVVLPANPKYADKSVESLEEALNLS